MKRNKWIGMGGTTLLHLLVALILWLVVIHQPEAQEEGGVPVMLGEVAQSQGDADPYTLTDVDVMPAEAAEAAPAEAAPAPPSAPAAPSKQDLMTQEEEKTVEVKKTPKTKETPKKTETTKAK
jgi:outer membrane biosynthesis protein TonB